MTGEYNYGIASRSSSDSEKMTESNCYYLLESGSSSINEKGNNEVLGTAVTDFSAKTLNGYQDSAVSKLSSLSTKEQLCQFVDIKGYEFAFAGSVAKLEKMSYTYTLKDGSEETVYQNNFTPDKYGYDMIIQENMNANLPIKISGTPLDNSCILEIEEGETLLDNKGCGNGAITITTGVKTNYYETTGKVRYSVLFSGPAPGEATQTPIVTETPTVTGTPIITKTPTVTGTPIVTKTPIVSKTPTVTETPIISKTPTVTKVPTVTETPMVTKMPAVTQTPKETENPIVTHIPEETAVPIETVKPVVTKKPAPSPKMDIQQFSIKNVKNSYIYTGKKITVKNVQVVKGNRTLHLHKDYTLTYLNNRNVGTARLVVKGIGNYKGKMVKNFKIVARSITKLKFSKLRTYRYTGKLIRPRIIVKYGTKRLRKGTEYTVTYRKNRNKGYGLMIIKGKGNFKGIKTFRFRII